MTAVGSASLEKSCRRLLRWFPRRWRAEHESELLEVLMQATPPGRRWPPMSKVVSMVGFGVRVWMGGVVSPRRATTHDAMSMLAVGLPVLLMFPATSAITIGASWPWSPSLFTIGIPGWLLWIMTVLLTIGGSAAWAGRVGAAGLAVSLAGEVAQLLDHNFRTVLMDGVWIGAQVVAVAALANQRRILRGRELIKPRILAVSAFSLGMLGAAYGLHGRWLLSDGDYSFRVAVFATAVGGTALAAVTLLLDRRGRALLPILGALAALGWASRRVAGQVSNFSAAIPDWFHFTPDMLLPVLTVPVGVFIALRIIAGAADWVLIRRRQSTSAEAPSESSA